MPLPKGLAELRVKPKPKQRPQPASFEFPKMLFKDSGDTRVAANVPELEGLLKDGWKERTR